MTKASLTPSVYLKYDIPESAVQSFIQSEVTNVVNDSVFETTGPFRHAASLVKIACSDLQMVVQISVIIWNLLSVLAFVFFES